jgi:hypothetical protein
MHTPSDTWLLRYWTAGVRGALSPKQRQAAPGTRAAPEDDLTKFLRQLQRVDVAAVSITRQSSSSSAMQEAAKAPAGSAARPPLVQRPSKKAEAQIVAALAHVLQQGCISSLVLSIKLQEPASWGALADALGGCSSLRRLSFAEAGFGDAVLLAWLQPLAHRSAGLQLLDLSGCGLGDAAAEALAGVIAAQAGGPDRSSTPLNGCTP